MRNDFMKKDNLGIMNIDRIPLGHIGKSQVGHIGKKEKSISVTLVKDVQVGHIGN